MKVYTLSEWIVWNVKYILTNAPIFFLKPKVIFAGKSEHRMSDLGTAKEIPFESGCA